MSEQNTARVISTLLSAPSVAAVVVVTLALASPFGSPSHLSTWQTISIGFAMLSFAPVVAVLYLHWKENLDLDVSDRRKRPVLLIPALLAYLLSAVVFAQIQDRSMYILSVIYFLVGLAHLAITFTWKISLHVAGLTSPITALILIYGAWLLPLYGLIIPLIWARMRLGAHTLNQAMAGAITSALITATIYIILA